MGGKNIKEGVSQQRIMGSPYFIYERNKKPGTHSRPGLGYHEKLIFLNINDACRRHWKFYFP
jgi:hypothetical protein